jgi:NAD(P)H dehydrogenase (quinone)
MPSADFRGALIGMGLSEDVAELIADSDIGASKGGLEENGRQLSALISRPTTPYRQTVELAVSAA